MMTALSTMLSQWVGTLFSIRVWRGGQVIATIPNRGSDYAPEPLTVQQLRQSFGPGRYLVEVVEPAPPRGGIFEDPGEQRWVCCDGIWVDA